MSQEDGKKANGTKTAKVIYWSATVLVVFFMGSGGVMMLMGLPENVQGITALGYPPYLCTILGAAKILGCIALLFGNRFPTIKEWAYAGLSFDLLGASASYLLQGNAPVLHIAAPLVIWGFVLVSHHQWKKVSRLEV